MNAITRRLPAALVLAAASLAAARVTDAVVDTGQDLCFNDRAAITPPAPGAAFHGQDAQYAGNPPSYTVSGDGLTVHDHVTGLTWTRSPDTTGEGTIDVNDKMTWAAAFPYAESLNAVNFGGYNDWRVPSIKELYSLIDFRGHDVSADATDLVPFIDTDYFDFAYGDTSAGERIIDAQFVSSTDYVAEPGEKIFGVNLADGRIKGYGFGGTGAPAKTFYVYCCRGNVYGANSFVDNGDGTVTDTATGLMWTRADSGSGMEWGDALAWAENLATGGHTDWRLPNAKELQSIVDYTRSPDTTNSPAIDPVFSSTSIVNEGGVLDWPFYWTSTTHISNGPVAGGFGAYVAFGRALGYMWGGWLDVHGAGAQRSDPKAYNGIDYPTGHGPQGDAVRYFNYARAVRTVATAAAASIDFVDGYNLVAIPVGSGFTRAADVLSWAPAADAVYGFDTAAQAWESYTAAGGTNFAVGAGSVCFVHCTVAGSAELADDWATGTTALAVGNNLVVLPATATATSLAAVLAATPAARGVWLWSHADQRWRGYVDGFGGDDLAIDPGTPLLVAVASSSSSWPQ